MPANKYELNYFPVMGRASMIRMFLEDQGIEYTFKTTMIENWLVEKPKTQFGALPVLTINGDTHLSQSHTIARYLGREHGFMGSNNLEQAQIEMWNDQCEDIRTKFGTMLYKNYENGLKPFLESIPTELAPFEKQLSSGDGKHLLFGKVTLADYIVFDLLHTLTALSADCLDKTPRVKAFHASFGARDKLRAFLNRPDIKSMRFTGSPHL